MHRKKILLHLLKIRNIHHTKPLIDNDYLSMECYIFLSLLPIKFGLYVYNTGMYCTMQRINSGIAIIKSIELIARGIRQDDMCDQRKTF